MHLLDGAKYIQVNKWNVKEWNVKSLINSWGFTANVNKFSELNRKRERERERERERKKRGRET